MPEPESTGASEGTAPPVCTEAVIAAEAMLARDLRRHLAAFLAAHHVSTDARMRGVLAAAEAINILLLSTSEAPITLQADLDADSADVVVRQPGGSTLASGITGTSLGLATLAHLTDVLSFEDLPEGGSQIYFTIVLGGVVRA